MILSGAENIEIWPLVRDYHYSGRMPGNIQHCYVMRRPGGLFGDTGEVIAGVIFSIPPTRWREPVIELSRLVRGPECKEPLTRLISYGCKFLRKSGWHLVVSFADWTEKHHGGIYQAAGWNFAGQRERRCDGILMDGRFIPGRSCNRIWETQSPNRLSSIFPDKEIIPHFDDGKFLYWRALTIQGKTRAKRLGLKKLKYPKPNAARPLDERVPARASLVQPEGAAP